MVVRLHFYYFDKRPWLSEAGKQNSMIQAIRVIDLLHLCRKRSSKYIKVR